MTFLLKACLGLFCLSFLAACGPNATPAAPTLTEAPTQSPSSTTLPSETPQPSQTPTLATQTVETTPGAADASGTQATQPAAANPSTGSKAPEKYTYLGQDVADRTQFLPNRTVTITWTIKNTGTVAWNKNYTLRYFAGPKPSKEVYAFTKDVAVNDTINFIVTFKTPESPGDYDLWFKLTNDSSQNFGDLDLVFTVSNNPVRAQATPTK